MLSAHSVNRRKSCTKEEFQSEFSSVGSSQRPSPINTPIIIASSYNSEDGVSEDSTDGMMSKIRSTQERYYDHETEEMATTIIDMYSKFDNVSCNLDTDETKKKTPTTQTVKDPIVFNKSLYKAETTVIITKAAHKVLARNKKRLYSRDISKLQRPSLGIRDLSRDLLSDAFKRRMTISSYEGSPGASTLRTTSDISPSVKRSGEEFTESDYRGIRCVVEGLKNVHKNIEYVKHCLAQVITEERYKGGVSIKKQPSEYNFSCYLILQGSLDVVYGEADRERHMYTANIVYKHLANEYIGILSYEGPDEDMAPPQTMVTAEPCHLLRIDRGAFHRLIRFTQNRLDCEKRSFIKSGVSVLSRIASEAVEKVIPSIIKQKYLANNVIVKQGTPSDFMFIVIEGRCVASRRVYIPESQCTKEFRLRTFETGDVFAEECILDGESSIVTVTSKTSLTCYKFPGSALQMTMRSQVYDVLANNRNQWVDDGELQNRGYTDALWDSYKRSVVVSYLRNVGKENLVSRKEGSYLRIRKDTHNDNQENMQRFIHKGNAMVPVRHRTTILRKGRLAYRIRPVSAPPRLSDTSAASKDTTRDSITRPRSAFCSRSKSIGSVSSPHPRVLSIVADENSEQRPQTPGSKSPSVDVSERFSSVTVPVDSTRSGVEKTIVEESSTALLDLSFGLRQETKLQANRLDYTNKDLSGYDRNFFWQNVITTLKSDDIVKKAKAAVQRAKAAVQIQKDCGSNDASEHTAFGDSIDEARIKLENKRAVRMIAACKVKSAVLSRQLIQMDMMRPSTKRKGHANKYGAPPTTNASMRDNTLTTVPLHQSRAARSSSSTFLSTPSPFSSSVKIKIGVSSDHSDSVISWDNPKNSKEIL